MAENVLSGYNNVALDLQRPLAHRVKGVFVDGKEVRHVYEYDTTEGWVRHYKVDEKGHLYRDETGEDIAAETLCGVVTVG